MRLLCPSDPRRCLPLLIGDGDSEQGARLGGRPPLNVRPLNKKCVYFISVPMDVAGTTYLSVFVNTSVKRFSEMNAKVLPSGTGVELIEHPAAPRVTQAEAVSEWSEHPLVPLDEIDDDVPLETGRVQPLSSHKVGGRPYFVQAFKKLRQSVEALEQQGYRQLLQLDFPGKRDAEVGGTWPFGDGVFHVFVKANGGPFYWFFEF